MYPYGPPHMAVQKQDHQLELTYSNYVRTQDVTLKTCRRRWMIGRSGERGSGISMLAARHDDDDDIYIYIYVCVCVCVCVCVHPYRGLDIYMRGHVCKHMLSICIVGVVKFMCDHTYFVLWLFIHFSQLNWRWSDKVEKTA